MADFIQRLNELNKKKAKFLEEKNRLEATIDIYEKNIKETESRLEDLGITFESLSDIDSEIREREQYLEEKITSLESIINAPVVSVSEGSSQSESTVKTEPINLQNTESTKLNKSTDGSFDLPDIFTKDIDLTKDFDGGLDLNF